MKFISKIAILSALMATYTLAQDNFRMYGFMDLSFAKYSTADNNFLNAESFINQRPSITLGNVNLYMDFKPNPKTRTLIEMAYNSDLYNQPRGQKVVLGEVTAASTGDPMVDGLVKQQLLPSLNAGKGTQLESAREEVKYGGIYIARAWADLNIMDKLFILRAGKFITPAGIWNVDHGSPIITPVIPPRQTSFMPIFPVSQTGLMVHGSQYLGDSDHELKYNVYASTGRSNEGIVHDNYSQDLENLGDLAGGAKLSLNLDMLDGITIGASAYSGMLKQDEDITVVNRELSAEEVGNIMGVVMTGGDPTELASGYIADAQLEQFSYNTKFLQKDRETAVGFDVKVKVANFTLQGELNTLTVENEMANSLGGKTSSFLAYYAMLSYELGLSDNITLSPYFMYEEITWEDVANTPSLGLHNTPLDGFGTTTIGLNFAFYNNYHLKLEYVNASILQEKKGGYPGANKFSDDDLDLDQFAGQISVAF